MCNSSQHTATRCTTRYSSPGQQSGSRTAHCNTVQHSAKHCNTDTCIPSGISGPTKQIWHNRLQHTATHCNTDTCKPSGISGPTKWISKGASGKIALSSSHARVGNTASARGPRIAILFGISLPSSSCDSVRVRACVCVCVCSG